ncbi:cytochrome P450 [Actinoplanes couchii]|uniref:cytochrome P450 n=1 Tax=Actinoplanes couchii TaxID=403638 RepID=UPI0019454A7D|nr:cytochrome P450 [Actinoplanes couchii]MDR6322290.1 cytochrome P450 [Actinoplanes couchii]
MPIDFADPGFLADPYPMLGTLRDRGPLVFDPGSGRWLAAGHAMAGAVLRDRRLGRFWRDVAPAGEFEPFNTLHRNQMMENEPPDHTRLRGLVATAFGRGHVERLRPAVAAEAKRLLALAGDGFDLLADFAEPLAVSVIAELLGVPAGERDRLRPWSAAMVRMYEMGRTPQTEAAAVRACREFAGYMAELAARRAAEPRDDLVSHLVSVRDGSDRLSGEELVASAILLLNAGHEASVNGLGNGIVALLEHPGELARVRSDRGLVAATVEEMLRYDSPSQLFTRTAAVDVDLGGVTVPAGGEVAALLGAANRDPAAFHRPDRFDAGRDPNPHLSFGAGLHFCLGAPLARIELQAAVGALLDHGPRMELAADPVRNPGFVLRGYASVRLSFP